MPRYGTVCAYAELEEGKYVPHFSKLNNKSDAVKNAAARTETDGQLTKMLSIIRDATDSQRKTQLHHIGLCFQKQIRLDAH